MKAITKSDTGWKHKKLYSCCEEKTRTVTFDRFTPDVMEFAFAVMQETYGQSRTMKAAVSDSCVVITFTDMIDSGD